MALISGKTNSAIVIFIKRDGISFGDDEGRGVMILRGAPGGWTPAKAHDFLTTEIYSLGGTVYDFSTESLTEILARTEETENRIECTNGVITVLTGQPTTK